MHTPGLGAERPLPKTGKDHPYGLFSPPLDKEHGTYVLDAYDMYPRSLKLVILDNTSFHDLAVLERRYATYLAAATSQYRNTMLS